MTTRSLNGKRSMKRTVVVAIAESHAHAILVAASDTRPERPQTPLAPGGPLGLPGHVLQGFERLHFDHLTGRLGLEHSLFTGKRIDSKMRETAAHFGVIAAKC